MLTPGVRFIMNSRLVAVSGTQKVTGVVLESGEVIECDVLIEAICSLPNVEFLHGNDIDIESGIHVDSSLRALRVSLRRLRPT